jgi:hypothetical protein
MDTICSNDPSLRLEYDWPSKQVIQELAQRAARLLVWAAIACRFIEVHDPLNRLDILLRGKIDVNSEPTLDALYKTALESTG